MRFFRLPVLGAILFFGVVCGQEKPKSQPTKETEKVRDSDVDVDFPEGGIYGFQRLLISIIDPNKINQYELLPMEVQEKIKKTNAAPDITLTANLAFTIEIDGTMSNISAKGENQSFNREIERAVKSIQTKWIPAEIKGKKMRSRMNFPLKMIY